LVSPGALSTGGWNASGYSPGVSSPRSEGRWVRAGTSFQVGKSLQSGHEVGDETLRVLLTIPRS
jgi:hypothetical protein